MSKVIYVCSRKTSFNVKDEMRLTKICKVLEPDNLSSPAQHRVSVNDKVAFGVMNHQSSLQENGNSLLLGYLYTQNRSWEEPKTEFPDGSYAIFRDSKDYFEVVSDAAASRTIWFYFDDNLFISSTSQRAIIMFLGDFVFDERVIPWMLSTGSLGPEFSWDKRIKRLGPDSSVILEKKNWLISTNHNPVFFSVKQRAHTEHKKLLKEAISETISSLKGVNYDEWALPLSGGYDSRAILCFINESGNIPDNLRTITWGLKASINEEGNDAKIAKKLADILGGTA